MLRIARDRDLERQEAAKEAEHDLRANEMVERGMAEHNVLEQIQKLKTSIDANAEMQIEKIQRYSRQQIAILKSLAIQHIETIDCRLINRRNAWKNSILAGETPIFTVKTIDTGTLLPDIKMPLIEGRNQLSDNMAMS